MNASDRQPNPLLVRLGGLLEAVLVRALALDAHTQGAIAALEGRRIGVELHGVNLALAILVRDGRLVVAPHWQQPADLNLRVSPLRLLALALRRGEDPSLPPGKVEISGDSELARRVEKLLRDFRPDIEEAFAKTFGDVLGVPLAGALGRAFRWSRATADALVQDSVEYLREESRDLIAPAEMDEFLDGVDAVRERAERLEARVQRLAQRRRGDTA